MICFHFSIFEPLETASHNFCFVRLMLWFAFILVSLNHWKQLKENEKRKQKVVICFHFSIFEPLETASHNFCFVRLMLWFAFILVSLNHWKQLKENEKRKQKVVICFHFSIFEPLETARKNNYKSNYMLWFAFILVSLNHWKQQRLRALPPWVSCDLLSF